MMTNSSQNEHEILAALKDDFGEKKVKERLRSLGTRYLLTHRSWERRCCQDPTDLAGVSFTWRLTMCRGRLSQSIKGRRLWLR